MNSQSYYLREQETVDGKLRDKKGVPPVAYITLIWNGDPAARDVARGIAICGCGDNWCHHDGVSKALSRARKAFGSKRSFFPIGLPIKGDLIREAGIRFMDKWRDRFPGEVIPSLKASYRPTLTEFEKQIMKDADERAAQTALVADSPDSVADSCESATQATGTKAAVNADS